MELQRTPYTGVMQNTLYGSCKEHPIWELYRTPYTGVAQNTLYGSYTEHRIRELRRTPYMGVIHNTLYGSCAEHPIWELYRTPYTGVAQNTLRVLWITPDTGVGLTTPLWGAMYWTVVEHPYWCYKTPLKLSVYTNYYYAYMC